MTGMNTQLAYVKFQALIYKWSDTWTFFTCRIYFSASTFESQLKHLRNSVRVPLFAGRGLYILVDNVFHYNSTPTMMLHRISPRPLRPLPWLYVSPVTLCRVSTALARRFGKLNNAWHFSSKYLSRRPNSDQGIVTELTWRSVAFLRSSCWRLSALSRRSHCVHRSFTVLTLR